VLLAPPYNIGRVEQSEVIEKMSAAINIDERTGRPAIRR